MKLSFDTEELAFRDQVRAFKGEEIEVETPDQMLARYQQSL